MSFSLIARLFFDLEKHSVRTAFMHVELTIFGIAIVFKYMSHFFFLQDLWLYSVGLIFLWMHTVWRSSQSETFDWERQAFSFLGLVLFFSVFVYGQIRPVYGGGAPISVDLILSRPTAFSSATNSRGLLVDEDSHG